MTAPQLVLHARVGCGDQQSELAAEAAHVRMPSRRADPLETGCRLAVDDHARGAISGIGGMLASGIRISLPDTPPTMVSSLKR